MKTKITATVIAALYCSLAATTAFAASNNYNSSKSNTAGITGDPIPGVDVSIEQTPSGISKKQTTRKDGSYSFKGLPPGNYLLHIHGKPDQKVTVGAAGTYSGTVASQHGIGKQGSL